MPRLRKASTGIAIDTIPDKPPHTIPQSDESYCLVMAGQGFDVERNGTASGAPGATDAKPRWAMVEAWLFFRSIIFYKLYFAALLKDVPGATSGSVSTFRPKVLWGVLAGYACQKRCQCHWLEARWRFSMSIIQDDFTDSIVSRCSSIKRTPHLGSSSSHQLSLSRTIKEAFRLLGHAVKGGQSVYTPQVTRCTISPRLAR
ncbi:hypothetical protein ARMGADRAFT_1167126 [Armillaria gallica]|uniref:Uncharacterized protein n=1 Tax=Armillaria gallica TaxID=47427 RepID=A0A2H3DS82_ARMGA|nr:hypothetical protein ARMGADRAFT_1167126 [Armillaria gallica]